MKAAAYARYSTDKQTENSIAYQFAKIEEYCKNNNIDISAYYADEAQSGTNTEKRTSFNDMIAAAKAKAFDAVVIYDISRGSRDVVDWFDFRKKMAALHISIISVEERLGDIYNPNDFLTELITVGLGQHQVLTTRQKSIDGTAQKAREGAFLGGCPPLGYDIENQKYVINNVEAETVRTIFRMYADGSGYTDIIKAVAGVTGKRGRPIGKNSLRSILTNERYIGTYSWNKRHVKMMRKWAGGAPNPNCITIEDAIPPIIDKNTWERVRKRMNDNTRNSVNKAKYTYLLSGLIECDCCGATYVGHCSTNKKGYKTRYYVCGNKYRTHTCTAKNINADELESFVAAYLKEYLEKIDFEEAAAEVCRQVNGASRDLSAEKTELTAISAKIKNGLNAVLSGMDIPELKDEIDKLRIRKSELEDIIAYNQSNKVEVTPAEIASLFSSSIENWSEDTLKSVVQRHVQKIYAHVDGTCTVNIGVHISGCGSTQTILCTTSYIPSKLFTA